MSRAHRAWQHWLFVLCAVGVASIAGMLLMQMYAADFGFRAKPTARPYVDRIVVHPGSAAASSGLRAGDLVDVRRLTPQARIRLAYGERAGEPIVVPVDGKSAVTLVTQQVLPVTWDVWLVYGSQLWMVMFCGLLAWRRPESREVRIVTIFLLAAGVIGQWQFLTPSAGFDAIAHACRVVILWGSFALLVVYAELFGRPLSAFRRGLGLLAYGAIAVTVGAFVVRTVMLWSGVGDPFIPIPVGRAALLVACLLPLLAAIGASRGSERTRAVWVTLAFGPLCLWAAAADVFPVLAPARDLVTNLGFLFMPAVLTYSLLSRKLVDIGFIVNRAAIFTAVSIVLFGSFVLLEAAFSDWLRNASRTTNVLVAAALALLLGFSVRLVHTRVDRIVDNVFFRKRHEDEQAIRTFAHEAPFITDRATLLARAAAILDRHTDAVSVEILLADAAGRVGTLETNDPAVVRLRATHETVDLHDFDSQMQGDLAFPVVARGELRGAIVLGARRSGEAYAPDESLAITTLAYSLGAALDVLSANDGESHDVILREVRDTMRALLARLPDDSARYV